MNPEGTRIGEKVYIMRIEMDLITPPIIIPLFGPILRTNLPAKTERVEDNTVEVP